MKTVCSHCNQLIDEGEQCPHCLAPGTTKSIEHYARLVFGLPQKYISYSASDGIDNVFIPYMSAETAKIDVDKIVPTSEHGDVYITRESIKPRGWFGHTVD